MLLYAFGVRKRAKIVKGLILVLKATHFHLLWSYDQLIKMIAPAQSEKSFFPLFLKFIYFIYLFYNFCFLLLPPYLLCSVDDSISFELNIFTFFFFLLKCTKFVEFITLF